MGEQERFDLARQINTDGLDVKKLAEPINPVFARDGTRIAELNRLTPLTLFFNSSRVYFTNMFSKYIEEASNFADLIERVRRRGVCTEFDDKY